MSDAGTIVPKCGHPCRDLAETLHGDFPRKYQWRFRTWCCRCENREPCSLCALLDTPEDKAQREKDFEVGRQIVEDLTSQVPDAAAVLAALPERLAADGRRMRRLRRGFRRLGIVLAVALSALLGLLLWVIDLGIVVVWLIGFAALAWAAVRAARWVLAGFRADSADTVDPRGPKGK